MKKSWAYLGTDDFYGAAQQLLPRGIAWNRDPDSTTSNFLRGFADGVAAVHSQAFQLSEIESDPRFTSAMLGDWESAFGLPDACLAIPQDVDQRRQALLERITARGGQSADYYIGVAAALGYTATISYFRPFRAGVGRAGDNVYGEDWTFAWRMSLVTEPLTVTFFTAGHSAAGDALESWGKPPVECVIQRVSPAHTALSFAFTSPRALTQKASIMSRNHPTVKVKNGNKLIIGAKAQGHHTAKAVVTPTAITLRRAAQATSVGSTQANTNTPVVVATMDTSTGFANETMYIFWSASVGNAVSGNAPHLAYVDIYDSTTGQILDSNTVSVPAGLHPVEGMAPFTYISSAAHTIQLRLAVDANSASGNTYSIQDAWMVALDASAADFYATKVVPAQATAANITTSAVSGQVSTINVPAFNSGETVTSVGIANAPSHGTATVAGTNITYQPAANYTGPDSFTYRVTNSAGTSQPATVSLTVTAAALNLIFSCSTYNDSTKWNKTDTPTVSNTLVADPLGGNNAEQITFTTNRSGFYQVLTPALTPNTTYNMSIYYKGITSGMALYLGYWNGSTPITQYTTNLAPSTTGWSRSSADFVTGASDAAPAFVFVNNNVDNATNATAGTIAIFGAQVTLGSGRQNFVGCATPPLPTAANITTSASTAIATTISIAGFNTGETITSVAVVSQPVHGSASVSGSNIIYTSAAGYTGADSMTYSVSNSAGTSNSGTITLNVTAATSGRQYMIGIHPGQSNLVPTWANYESILGVKFDCMGIYGDPNNLYDYDAPNYPARYYQIFHLELQPNNGSLAQVAAGTFDSSANGTAGGFINSFKQLAASPGPQYTPVVRIGWEFNIESNPGAPTAYQEGAAAFIAAWKHLAALRDQYAPNAMLCWCPNVATNSAGQNGDGTVQDPTPFYPGDAYVDMIALDCYLLNFQNALGANLVGSQVWPSVLTGLCSTWAGGQGSGLNWLSWFATTHNKTIGMMEWSNSNNDDGSYITKMAQWMDGQPRMAVSLFYDWGQSGSQDSRVNQTLISNQNWVNAYKAAWDGTSFHGSWMRGSTGGGSTGGSTPTSPSQASAVGYSTLRFSDDFTSLNTIDVNGTRASGFNWYPNTFFGVSTPSTAYTVSNSILQINNDVSGFGMGLVSACPGSPYVGQAFTNGFYAECRMAFNPALANPTFASWPAFWSMSVEHLDGATNTNFAELDFFEAFPTGTGVVAPTWGFHSWVSSVTGQQNVNTNGSSAQIPPGNPDYSLMHIYGTLWVPMSQNNGTGYIKRFFDNVELPGGKVTYSANAPSSDAAPANPNGTYSQMDAQHAPMILGCGPNWPLLVDWVRVWQL